MIATRISNSFCAPPTLAGSSAMLVRIYPQQGIGEPFELTEGCSLVGRENCNLSLPDDSVSRRHASIDWADGTHVVCDLGSTNGTFVNEARVSRQPLKIGDRLRFGNQIFKYLTADGIESQYHEVVYKIMTTDGLTQVYNKQYFLESADRELEYARRTGIPLSIMLLDLDRFKAVNDTHGHLAGDAVLIEFAKRARSVLRSGEVFARYGGEEFAMLCPQASTRDAVAAAERLRQAVSVSPVEFESINIPVTVSVGVSSTESAKTLELSELLADADHWLYAAKEAGRNQVQYR